MVKKRELSANLRSQIIELYRGMSDFGQMSKILGISRSTIQSVVEKWRIQLSNGKQEYHFHADPILLLNRKSSKKKSDSSTLLSIQSRLVNSFILEDNN